MSVVSFMTGPRGCLVAVAEAQKYDARDVTRVRQDNTYVRRFAQVQPTRERAFEVSFNAKC